MKANDQYFRLVLFIILYKAVLALKSVCINPKCVTIQIKAIEQYFHVVLYIYAVQHGSDF